MRIKAKVFGLEGVPVGARLHARPPKSTYTTSMRIAGIKVEEGYRLVTLEPLVGDQVSVGDTFPLRWGNDHVANAEVVEVDRGDEHGEDDD